MLLLPPTSTLFPYTTLFRSFEHLRRGIALVHFQLVEPGLEHLHGRGAVLVLAALVRSEEHTSELQSQSNLVCRLLLEKKQHHPGRGVAARGADAARVARRVA